jgi:branched-chain amino acid transport system substrate-binding protein
MAKILLLAANPKDNYKLRLDEEVREIQQAIGHARYGSQLQFDPRGAVRLKDLLDYLERAKPDIVHFCGHGSAASEIVLVDGQGNSYLVQRETMQRIFSLLQGKTQCVVLNACYSEPLARAIAENMKCVVVGMSGEVNDLSAIEFATGFYRQLADGKDVSTAFRLASTHVSPDIARSIALNIDPSKLVFVTPPKRAFYKISGIILIIVAAILLIYNLFDYYVFRLPLPIGRIEVPIGVAIALSGNAYPIGEEQERGILIAEEYFEQKYENYEITIEWKNAGAEGGKTDIDNAKSAFTELVASDVTAILGPTLSSHALVVDYIAQEGRVPVIAISNTHPRIVTDIGDYIFRVSAGVEKYTPKILSKVSARLGVKTAILLYLNEPDSFTIPECEEGFSPSLGSNGMTSVSELIPYQTIVADDISERDQVLELIYDIDPLPEVVIICGLTDDGVALIKGLKEKHYQGVIIGGNGLSTPSFLSQCDGRCEGTYLAQAYNYTSQSPLNEDFKKAYKTKYGSNSPTQFAAQAFTGIHVILEAINNIENFKKMSQTEKRIALKEFFLSSNHRYNTLLGSFRFDQNGDIEQENFTIVKVVNNKFEPQ